MRVFERYIHTELLWAYGLVNVVLLGLFGFFDLSVQLDDSGQGSYSSFDAVRFTLYQLPLRWIELTPFSALLATVIALGLMASHRELTVLRSAAISPARITASVLKAGGVLLVVVIFVSLYVAPSLAQRAEQMRATAMAGGRVGGDSGFWMRARNGVIHIGELREGRVPVDVDIYRYGPKQNLERYLHAARVDIGADGGWRLYAVTDKRFDNNAVQSRHRARLAWRPGLYAEQLQLLDRPPQSLSPWSLYRYANYLRAHDQDAQGIRVALWQKLAVPLTTIAMLLLAAPLTFGSPRGAHLGVRIAAAAALGLLVYAFIQSMASLSLLFDLSPPLLMLTPAFLAAGIAILWLRRLP